MYFFKKIYEISHHIGMKKIVLMLIITISVVTYLVERKKKRRKTTTDEDLEKIYKRNEKGQFPWEVDTNDSPKDIPKNAKRYHYDQGRPRRGKW